MTVNEILKKLILKNNTLFNSLGIKVALVFDATLESNSDKAQSGCNVCTTSDDDMVYIHSKCLEDWKTEIFAFRDWGKISSILNLFPNDVDISLKYDDENCPCLLKFSSPNAKVNHYLQSKKFVKIQENSSAEYKRKKFSLETLKNSNFDFDKESLKQMSRASSILDDKLFSFLIEDDKLFAVFGDENTSVDNIKVYVGEADTSLIKFEKTKKFSYENFASVIKSYNQMEGITYIQIMADKIYLTNIDGDIITTTIIRSK